MNARCLCALLFPTLFASPTGAQCEFAKLVADVPVVGAEFGFSVALDGDFALIGAPKDLVQGVKTGSVYVFERRPGGWVQVARLTPSDGFLDLEFGFSVALDGDTALIGTLRGNIQSGSAYAFERDPAGNWTQTDKLVAPDGQAFDNFGRSVTLSGDTAILGSHGHDTPLAGAGVAYVFERVGSTWTPVQKLKSSAPLLSAGFGRAVTMEGDRAVIGAYFDHVGGLGTGLAYVFERSGGTWSQVARLIPSSATGGAQFGGAVDLSGDTAAVAAFKDQSSGTGIGSVFVYELNVANWVEAAKLSFPVPGVDKEFGRSLSVDGELLLVGAPLIDTGAAYLFERTHAGWVFRQSLFGHDTSGPDQLGRAVAIEGEQAVVCARWEDVSGVVFAGTAYVIGTSPDACLEISAETFPVDTGGVQQLEFWTSPNFASFAWILLGTGSGTSPGLPLDGLVLPLNFDAYSLFTLQNPTLGFLDGQGHTLVQIPVPAGLPASLAGTVLHHAFLVIGPSKVDAVSAAAPLTLVP